MTEEEKAKRREEAFQRRAGAAAIGTAERERNLALRLNARRALAERNVAAMGMPPQEMNPGDQLGGMNPDAIARRRLQAYSALNPDMARRFAGPVPQQPVANVPEAAPNPLDGARVSGRVVTDEMFPNLKKTKGGGEVGVSGDPAMAAASGGLANVADDPATQAARDRLQAIFNDPKRIADRAAQSHQARMNAMKPGFVRPTTAGNNEKRRQVAMQRYSEMLAAQMAPQIALAQAQNGMTPDKQAVANYHKAQADAINFQIEKERQAMAAEAAGKAGAAPPPANGSPITYTPAPRPNNIPNMTAWSYLAPGY